MSFEKFEKEFKVDITNYTQWPHYSDGHFHDGYELYFLFWGSTKYMIENSIHEVNEGDIVWIPPDMFHKTRPRNLERHKRMLFYITPSFIESFLTEDEEIREFISEFHVLHPTGADLRTFRKLSNMLLEEYLSELPSSHLAMQGILMAIIVHLKRICDENRMHNSKITKSSVDHHAPTELKILLSYINNKYNEDINLSILSEQVNMSSVYISSLFKKHFGFTFKEYLLDLRINKAMEMLKTTTASVESIAFDCGFNSSNHFCKTFKRLVGMPPLMFRNISKEK